MSAIFKREFKAYFTSPVGYVILAAFFFSFGLLFWVYFANGLADISYVFQNQLLEIVVMVVLIPVLTMRLLSEDKRLKTDQALLTAPVKLSGIVLGKFFAAFAVYALGIAITLIFQILFSLQVTTDWAVYLGCVIGILLFGAALIAIDIFMSSLTESQVVAFVCSFAVAIALVLLEMASSLINVSFINTIVNWISFIGRYNAFTTGVFDFSNAIFFLSFTVTFLFFAVRMLESRRWA